MLIRPRFRCVVGLKLHLLMKLMWECVRIYFKFYSEYEINAENQDEFTAFVANMGLVCVMIRPQRTFGYEIQFVINA